MIRTIGICGIVIVLAVLTGAGSPTPAQQPENLAELSKTLKPMLADALPQVLYEKDDNWGHTTMVVNAVRWHGLRPELGKTPRNDGKWKHLKISVRNPKQTVDIRMYGLKKIDDDKQTFSTDLTFMCEVDYDQQNWESGARLWSGSVRARAQVKLDMDCEDTLRVEFDKNNLPDFILRLRVTGAKLHYDKLVFEHINGIGGDGAKIIGKAAHDVMNRWRPSIERDVLAKASDAIVKTADTREIRVGFGGLLKTK